MTADATREEIEALARLLDAFGASKARWPAGQRAAAEALIARDPAARRLFAEAQALDRVLAVGAGEPALDRHLAERIIAAALAGAGPAGSGAPASGEARPAVVVPLRRPALPVVRPQRASWKAAGLMAASLFAGLYLGGGGAMTPVIEGIAEVAGLSLESDPVIALIGQETAGIADEDLL